MSSIRRTLLLWLSAGLFASILGAAALVYVQAREEANELFDYQMKQLAASLPRQPFAPMAGARTEESEEDIVIQIWDSSGERIYHSHEHSVLPQRAELGFSNVSSESGTWRIYSALLGDTVVQVAQPNSARRDLAAQLALNTVAPLLLLFPVLGALLWVGVGRGLSTLRRVADDVQSRDAGALTPISEQGLPSEIRPLAHALNDLLSRLGHSMDAQRALVADAAHELRTPLTALKLQAQLAERAVSALEREAAFSDLKEGLERAIHLVHQILTLARQEEGALGQKRERVDLCALARSVVADFALAADVKAIDLGVQAQAPAHVSGDADALRILLNNLVDNALRHTPREGRIDVAIEAADGHASIIVQDTGPGIPDAELARVFDRFYRGTESQTEGSGLGLAIVKQIAVAHGASVELTNIGKGLRACVIFSGPASKAVH